MPFNTKLSSVMDDRSCEINLACLIVSGILLYRLSCTRDINMSMHKSYSVFMLTEYKNGYQSFINQHLYPWDILLYATITSLKVRNFWSWQICVEKIQSSCFPRSQFARELKKDMEDTKNVKVSGVVNCNLS